MHQLLTNDLVYSIVDPQVSENATWEILMKTTSMRQPARSFEDLVVWRKAHALVLQVYRATRGFPRSEMYGLTSQMRRAAVSIPSNIVEGFKRSTLQEKLRFLNISQSSLEELRYQLILARDLEYLNAMQILTDLSEVSQLLESYMQGIRRRMANRP
jgi:four helix bundle protein